MDCGCYIRLIMMLLQGSAYSVNNRRTRRSENSFWYSFNEVSLWSAQNRVRGKGTFTRTTQAWCKHNATTRGHDFSFTHVMWASPSHRIKINPNLANYSNIIDPRIHIMIVSHSYWTCIKLLTLFNAKVIILPWHIIYEVGTLAADGWTVIFGTERRGLSGAAATPSPLLAVPNVTAHPSPASARRF